VAASLSVNVDLHTLRAKLFYLGDADLNYQTFGTGPFSAFNGHLGDQEHAGFITDTVLLSPKPNSTESLTDVDFLAQGM